MYSSRLVVVITIIIVLAVCISTGLILKNFTFNIVTENSFQFLPASKVLSDITYCTVNGTDIKMDMYFPIKFDSNPSPVLVYIHGGAWIFGDKEINTGRADLPELLSRGYVIATVNYRLAPDYQFPSSIEDVKCAVRYLRANAEKYNIDPNYIGAWGDSAGGHLVSLLALTNRSAGFDVGQYLEYSSSIQAVVDYFGPENLTDPNFYNIYSIALDGIFGSYENMIKASPTYYISNDSSKYSPPFLIFQGDKDIVVFQSQSQEFYKKLIENNVTATLVMVNGSGHGFVSIGSQPNPSRSEVTKMVADFFDKYIKIKITVTGTVSEIPYLLDYQYNVIYLQTIYKGKIDEKNLGSPVPELLKYGWKVEYKDFPQHDTTPQRVTIG
jgi:acetyl esterase/lipase